MGFARTHSVALRGAVGHLIDVQVDVSPGQVGTTLVGRADAALSEGRDRVRMAIVNSRLEWPSTRRITVLLSPADLPKTGTHYDVSRGCNDSFIRYPRTMSGQALIYCRISADPEGRAIGVARQEADCRELAARLGLEVAGVYVENDVSASTKSTKARPKYAAMVGRVKAGGVTAVLAYSNSRLTRRPLELEDVIKLHEATGVRVATVVSGEDNLATADGRMTARIKASVDAAEAERTAERVQRAKRQSAENGTYRGGPRPFGYESDGVTIRPDEADAIRSASRQVLDGVSLGRIAEEWRAAGHLSTRGQKPIRPADVGRILRRARNAGLLDHRGALSQAVWPPLVDRSEWEAVRAVLDSPERRTNQTDSRPRWLLSGIAHCHCGGAVRHGVNHGHPHYRCSTKGCGTSRNQPLSDKLVLGVVVERLRRPDVADLLRLVDTESLEEAAELRRTITGLEARLDALAVDTALSERMLAKRSAALEAELDAASARLDLLNAAIATAGPSASVLTAREPAAAFLAADLHSQRAVVSALMNIEFLPGKKGRPKGWTPGEPYFDPESISIEWRHAQ